MTIRLANEHDADRSLDVRQLVEEFLKDEADTCEVAIVLAITKGGAQILRTSGSTAIEKSFLLAFFQAHMTNWFQLGDD